MTVPNPTAMLTPMFDEHFKFKIGDLVCFSWLATAALAEQEINGLAKVGRYDPMPRMGFGSCGPMTVVGRRMEECQGGVQTHYLISGRVTPDGKQAVIIHQEFELMALSEAVESLKALRPVVSDE